MTNPRWTPEPGCTAVVGSIGNAAALAACKVDAAMAACDLIELRLDLYGVGCGPDDWAHLRDLPMLMTARRTDEGGGGLSDTERLAMLEMALPDAALVDLEVASIEVAADLLDQIRAVGVPWVASCHDFERTPESAVLREKAAAAREAGAAVFKAAARIQRPDDLARLADFQLDDHGIAVATMGMGPLAVVSRLLCAQCGSVLNYGYLGRVPTAPGQWSAAELRGAIGLLESITG